MKYIFEWNQNKAAKNFKKRRISFEEASTVFNDPMFITVVDEEHSVDEERYITTGLSDHGRLLLVAHTDRKGKIRIISARKAVRKEKKFYAKS